MNTVSQAKLQQLMQNPEKIHAKDLVSVLDRYGDKIKVLSLDCFDTILWRVTATPKDVFYDLNKNEMFDSLGFNGWMRIGAEGKARHVKAMQNGTSEVNLHDIYNMGFHELTDEQIEKLVNDELEAEMAVCYAFPPMLELIREAHRRNIKIVIVSDTYLLESQLKKLLSHRLPSDVLSFVSEFFCSCEYGKSKPNGIFVDVIQKLKYPPDAILHIGDNLVADYVMPRSINVNALQFIHQEEYISDLMRLQDTSAKILDPSIGTTRSLASPFRPVFAVNAVPKNNPEALIGYASLGPIMYAFARFICDEVEQLKQDGKQPKVLFLMRDAYLPSLACTELAGAEMGKRVRISRFASYAASFCSIADIDNYLIEIGNTNRFRDVARQLLLPDKVAEPLIKVIERAENPKNEFFKLIHRSDIVRIILKKSEEYRARLLSHLNKEIGLEAGTTLVLVDLGYSGTAQRRLTPVFEKIGIEVVGRYLISLRVPGWKANRRGLIDPSWCDDRAMQTIVMYIMLLEQLCTSNEKSVIDYDDQGNPIYSNVMMSDQQQMTLERIQSECVRFVRDAKSFFQHADISLSREVLRQSALSELTRMIFLPTEIELQHLQTFEAEMNLGTQDILRVFDPEQGLTGLRRRGMFYMEKPSKTTRTNYPAELRMAGIELVLALIAQHRFSLDLKLKDMVIRKEFLQIVFRQNNDMHKLTTDAVATHDGYFALWLPTKLHTSIMLGEKYKWVQVESAELIPMEAFVNQNETQNTADVWSHVILNQVTNHGGNLLELPHQNSCITINPFGRPDTNDFVFRLVFRPIVRRTEPAANNNVLAGTG